MDREDLEVNLKAVLTSGGGSLSESQFLKDYWGIIGEKIPYKELGYPNLVALLQAFGSFKIIFKDGQTYINSVADEKTAHLASLIARQKRKPGEKKGKGRRNTFSRSFSRPLSRPPRLEVRYPPIPRTAISAPRAARAPPAPRYGNPPIVPQRQPLPSVQNRLEVLREAVSQQTRLDRGDFKREAESRILFDYPVVNGRSKDANEKETVLVEELPNGAAGFVDIQWLQNKVARPKPRPPPPATVPASAARAASATAPAAASAARSAPAAATASATRAASAATAAPVAPAASLSSLQEGPGHELCCLAAKLGLPNPIFQEILQRPFRRKPYYISKVKIGDVVYSSYPEERATAEEAKEIVCGLACNELKKRLGRVSISDDTTDIENRIFEIIRDKPNGVFDQAVVTSYEEKHKATLPLSWLKTIEKSPKFTVERFGENKSILYPAKTVCNSNDKEVDSTIKAPSVLVPPLKSRPATVLSPTLVTPDNPTKLTVDINANTTTAPRLLPGLVLPMQDTWDVFVSSVQGSWVWVRLIGDLYDVKYNDMINDLELKMLSNEGSQVTNPIIDEIYCAKFESCWLRVQLKEIDKDECVVFLVDNGEEDTIPLSDLKVLEDKYVELPAQAVACRLAYTDITYEVAQSYLMTQVVGGTFVAEILQLPVEENVTHIVLHNTEVEGESININNKVLEIILKELKTPVLPSKHVCFVRITNIVPKKNPWLNIKSRELALLEGILDEVYKNMDIIAIHGLRAHPKILKNNKNKMYLVKSSKNPQSWRRGVLVDTKEDSRNPLVYFVDFGYTENVMLGHIFDLDMVMPPLKSFPHQAVQVSLCGLPSKMLNRGIVNRLKELVSDKFVIGKITSAEDSEIELFKRCLPDNIIASINSDLMFSYDEFSMRTIEEEQNKMELTQRGSLESTNPLKLYQTPSEDSDYFDVFVSMSSNPFNFVVQPVKELNSSFNMMMKDLQDVYEAQHSVMPVPLMEDLQENATFAAKHPEDLQWYRVSVVTALKDSMVSVRYSDYGDVGLVPADCLRYLDPMFRKIPALAIRARLHGIKPTNYDWSVTECVYFNKLVDSEAFVSKVMTVNHQSDFSSWQVSLTLIDTTKEDFDVDIAAVLIKEGMAEKVVD